jgi:pyruvate formate lyase activating enzyme
MKEADYWKARSDGRLACLLCPHVCRLDDGDTGLCNARRREGDRLYSLNYGRITSLAMDPIEKKPLYHFHPGSQILSIGTFGCSFRCPFCQNAEISQGRPHTREVTAEEVVKAAKAYSSVGIAYTYNEPMIWMEFVKETAALARREGLKNVVVSNGYVNPKPLDDLMPDLDAANIDIKSIEESFYHKLCRAKLRPVLDACVRMRRAGIHVEVTNLIIPGENDSDENFSKLRDWVHDNLGADTPVHLSAYHPMYRFTAPPTPVDTMERAFEIVSRKLRYTYLGNVWSTSGANTRCPNCGKDIVKRAGYRIDTSGLSGGNCASCGSPAPLVT